MEEGNIEEEILGGEIMCDEDEGLLGSGVGLVDEGEDDISLAKENDDHALDIDESVYPSSQKETKQEPKVVKKKNTTPHRKKSSKNQNANETANKKKSSFDSANFKSLAQTIPHVYSRAELLSFSQMEHCQIKPERLPRILCKDQPGNISERRLPFRSPFKSDNKTNGLVLSPRHGVFPSTVAKGRGKGYNTYDKEGGKEWNRGEGRNEPHNYRPPGFHNPRERYHADRNKRWENDDREWRSPHARNHSQRWDARGNSGNHNSGGNDHSAYHQQRGGGKYHHHHHHHQKDRHQDQTPEWFFEEIGNDAPEELPLAEEEGDDLPPGLGTDVLALRAKKAAEARAAAANPSVAHHAASEPSSSQDSKATAQKGFDVDSLFGPSEEISTETERTGTGSRGNDQKKPASRALGRWFQASETDADASETHPPSSILDSSSHQPSFHPLTEAELLHQAQDPNARVSSATHPPSEHPQHPMVNPAMMSKKRPLSEEEKRKASSSIMALLQKGAANRSGNSAPQKAPNQNGGASIMAALFGGAKSRNSPQPNTGAPGTGSFPPQEPAKKAMPMLLPDEESQSQAMDTTSPASGESRAAPATGGHPFYPQHRQMPPQSQQQQLQQQQQHYGVPPSHPGYYAYGHQHPSTPQHDPRYGRSGGYPYGAAAAPAPGSAEWYGRTGGEGQQGEGRRGAEGGTEEGRSGGQGITSQQIQQHHHQQYLAYMHAVRQHQMYHHAMQMQNSPSPSSSEAMATNAMEEKKQSGEERKGEGVDMMGGQEKARMQSIAPENPLAKWFGTVPTQPQKPTSDFRAAGAKSLEELEKQR